MSVRGAVFRSLALLIGLSPPLSAQGVELPTPEEYAERAEVAENAPLFQSEEPLQMTLLTDIKWLRDKRIDTMEVDGTLTFAGADGAQIEQVIEVRTRGIFRRNKRNCNFPPLRRSTIVQLAYCTAISNRVVITMKSNISHFVAKEE